MREREIKRKSTERDTKQERDRSKIERERERVKREIASDNGRKASETSENYERIS